MIQANTPEPDKSLCAYGGKLLSGGALFLAAECAKGNAPPLNSPSYLQLMAF